MEKQHIYADGVESITMLEGMVRLDLFCYEDANGQGKVTRRVAEQLIMPPAAFLRAYEAMGELVRRMEQGGVVKRRENTPAATSSPTVSGAGSSSPNFE